MKKLLILTIFTLVISGCNLIGGTKEAEKPKEAETTEKPKEQDSGAKFKVGDTVVAQWTKNSFYEGEAESIDGNKVKVKWQDGSSPSDVEMADVFALPKAGDKPDVKEGDIVLAKTSAGSRWYGAEITGIEGDVYKIKTVADNTSSNMPAEKIIKLTPVIAANMKDKGGATDFRTEAHSKTPTAPDNFKPKAGEQVLAEWATNSWWQGKVQKVSGNKVTIAWEDGSTPSEIEMAKVLPMPDPKGAKMPASDQFVLAKPPSGTKWKYAQTVEVKGSEVEVKFEDGKTQNLKAGEFVVLN